MIEPLPPDIEQMFAAERGATVITGAARVSIRNKLIASIGLAPLGSAAAGTLLSAAKLLTAFVAISIGASAVRYAPSPPRPVHAPSLIAKTALQSMSPSVVPPRTPIVVVTPVDERIVARADAVAAPSPGPAAHPVTVAAAAAPVDEHITPSVPIASPVLDVGPGPVTTIATTPSVAIPPLAVDEHIKPPLAVNVASSPRIDVPAPGIAVAQAKLLVAAWKALAANDPQRALSLVDDDRRAHRDSPLDEERSALEIAALASTHRVAEARAASIEFFARYPHSVHRALVERAVDRKELR